MMELWGVELHPHNPILLSWENARGRRLRITQATEEPSWVPSIRSDILCQVGNRRPVLICSLISNSLPSMHIELEFEEREEEVVVFSVNGTRTVFLTGYYIEVCPTK